MYESFVNKALSKWMEGTGDEGDIVISSRIRLARNLSTLPFPHLLNSTDAKKVVTMIHDALQSLQAQEEEKDLVFINLLELQPMERAILVDKHLISPQHADEVAGRGLIVSLDESVSILINEEDHLRIQCLYPGLELEKVWNQASKVDDLFESQLDFAFDEKLGYLTACPTNVGTGMRASVMMHLPALVMTNQASRVLASLTQLGMTVRGLFGEGTEATGNLFQISNQVTLGRSEEEIISNLLVVAKQLIDQERMARHLLLKETKKQLEDQVWRAYGILTHARVISSQEAMSLLSKVRLGTDMGMIKTVSPQTLNEMLVLTRPAFLQKVKGKDISAFERDAQRATIIREKLLTEPLNQ
ncbi:protein arginine kinase [Heliorestis acidaminivorans]|uniref:Protein-arginine kinase n=1 Tax=Heliorestis acidaminivorans TaxID=553427 RepID=A0A6I0EY17_9FIRM|nr:protein arginine kinase [Heliorestis acidaminivorans]KAB2951445.1 protein arginine kinase [Heliorestis acidaminivorans]